MPKSTRDYAKRDFKASQQNIKWSMYHLEKIYGIYKEAHPEITDKIDNVFDVLTIAYNLIESIDNNL